MQSCLCPRCSGLNEAVAREMAAAIDREVMQMLGVSTATKATDSTLTAESLQKLVDDFREDGRLPYKPLSPFQMIGAMPPFVPLSMDDMERIAKVKV